MALVVLDRWEWARLALIAMVAFAAAVFQSSIMSSSLSFLTVMWR